MPFIDSKPENMVWKLHAFNPEKSFDIYWNSLVEWKLLENLHVLHEKTILKSGLHDIHNNRKKRAATEVLQVIFEFSSRSDRTYSNRGINFTKWEWREKMWKNPPKKTSHRRDGAKCSSYTNIIYVMFKKLCGKYWKKSLVLFPVLPSLPELFSGWLCSDILNDFVVTYISQEKRTFNKFVVTFFSVSYRLFADSRRIHQTQSEHDIVRWLWNNPKTTLKFLDEIHFHTGKPIIEISKKLLLIFLLSLILSRSASYYYFLCQKDVRRRTEP